MGPIMNLPEIPANRNRNTDPDRNLRELVQAFKILADETRLRIITILARDGETNVGDLCRQIGQSQPAISHHLALMRVSGFVEARRDGKNVCYSIVAERFADLRGFLPTALATAESAARPASQPRKATHPARRPKAERTDAVSAGNGEAAATVNGAVAVEEIVAAVG